MREMLRDVISPISLFLSIKLLETKFYINLSESGKTRLPTLRDVQSLLILFSITAVKLSLNLAYYDMSLALAI